MFTAPWEAQAFAMVVALQARGLFGWAEWAGILGREIERAQARGDPDHGDTYYTHWLAALEQVIEAKGMADPALLERYRGAWAHAAARVPHGQPIELTPGDFAA